MNIMALRKADDASVDMWPSKAVKYDDSTRYNELFIVQSHTVMKKAVSTRRKPDVQYVTLNGGNPTCRKKEHNVEPDVQ